MTRTRHALRCRAVWTATVLVVAVLLVITPILMRRRQRHAA